MRNLIIREGRVGLWRNEQLEAGERDERFFEVVTNHQIISVLQERFYARKSAEKQSVEAPRLQ